MYVCMYASKHACMHACMHACKQKKTSISKKDISQIDIQKEKTCRTIETKTKHMHKQESKQAQNLDR